MYYSIFDQDTGGYLHSGRNSTTKEEAKACLISYLSVGVEDDETMQALQDSEPEDVAEIYFFELHAHDELLPDEYAEYD